MKNLILGTAMLLCGGTVLAQNQNVTDISKTTVTTVKDSDGSKQMVKTQNVQEVQNVELQNPNSTELNKDVKPSPVQVTATTQVTGPDGVTRTIDVDRTAYHSLAGNRWRMALDNAGGYRLTSPDNKTKAVLRPTQNNSYIYRAKDRTSIGYFDANGNLVLETYDDKTDKVTIETYTRNQQ